jgi:hypothetical protein
MSTLITQNGEDRTAPRRSTRLFTDLMTNSARESMELRGEISKRILAIELLLRLEGLKDAERGCLAEAYARSLIGGIVALYLERFGPEPRERAKHLLLAAADAISESLRAPRKPGVKRGAS